MTFEKKVEHFQSQTQASLKAFLQGVGGFSAHLRSGDVVAIPPACVVATVIGGVPCTSVRWPIYESQHVKGVVQTLEMLLQQHEYLKGTPYSAIYDFLSAD